MTLIVAVKCADGAVLAADGAATFGVMGQQTIRQPMPRKLSIIRGRAVLGVSGSVGLGQRYQGELTTLIDGDALKGNAPHEAMSTLRQSFWKHQGVELQVSNIAKSVQGNQPAFMSSTTTAVVAIPLSSKLSIFTFDQQGSPEELTEDIPFACTGSGQQIADPFVAFLRRVLWPGRLPAVNEGVLTAYWTVVHCIETNPGGVAEPIQIITISRPKKDFVFTELTKDDLEEPRQAIDGAEKALQEYFGPSTETPPPPKPSA